MKILFFDTETSGLPINYKAPVTDVDNWPRLVQLGWEMYEDGDLITSYQGVVKPIDFMISEGASEIHGIDMAKAMKIGNDRIKVVTPFMEAVQEADIIVCHNVLFDTSIMGAEFIRINGENPIDGKRTICTMKSSTKYCGLPHTFEIKPGMPMPGNKWPKLIELHKVLFLEGFDGAHDALSDVKATVRCFFELIKRKVIEL